MKMKQHRDYAKVLTAVTTRPVPQALIHCLEANAWDVVQSVDMHGAVFAERDPDDISINRYTNWHMKRHDPQAFYISICLPSISVESALDHLMLAIDPEVGIHSIDPEHLRYFRKVRTTWVEEVDDLHIKVEASIDINFRAPLSQDDIHLLTGMNVIRYEPPYIGQPELVASCQI